MGLFRKKSPKVSSYSEKTNGSLHPRLPLNVEKLSSSVQQSGRNSGLGQISPTMSVPDIPIPKPPDPALNPAAYLKSIHSVRERSKLMMEKATSNSLNHFDVNMDMFQNTANYVVSIIKRDFADDYQSIPPHGRWQHFDVGGRPRVDQLLQSWLSTVDAQERARRVIDLFTVSVLLDAGAGNKWSYRSKESGKVYRRSEGLAVASLEMFKTGAFSSDPGAPHRVDKDGLKKVTLRLLERGMQVSEDNPMAGLEGRAGLLMRLSDAMANTKLFGSDGRPGNMIDYLLSHPTTRAASVPIVSLPTLWEVLTDGLAPIWPDSRTQINGVSIGDAWPCSSMPRSPPAQPWENIVPFHKLTQWLCYSLMVPMTKLLNIQFAGSELLTGLPEYRNGGLLIDTGLLTLKVADMERGIVAYKHNAELTGQPSMEVIPMFEAADDVIVEWRALTVGFLDMLLDAVNKGLRLTGEERLSLAQMLEAGSWKGGREIAEVSRPNTKEPPIMIISDGTVF
ncbi:hypothetical protein GJ744_005164 [Endocarpon pusillum]|uniref:Uracil catabolism protein 4 n=1 Tax=Endocarpon pusillum TaxID=364733 RepID=A0A8H7A886_9EURO|nr:hypothetical protein GJ744_005164 [Endocarpon pusillum]